MEISVKIDGKKREVELPFWQGFKVWILSYLAFLGMAFAVGFFIGLIIEMTI